MGTLTKTVTVQGIRPNVGSPQSWWNETGIYVSENDDIVFDATSPGGSIKPWGGHPGFDPNGDDTITDWAPSLAYRSGNTNCPFGSLIGKVGENGTAFFIGDSKTVSAPATGCLYLAFNDGVNFQDNAGDWDVEVTYEDSILLLGEYGTDRVKLDKIDFNLFDTYGVVLTVQSDVTDASVEWDATSRANISSALSLINSRLQARTTRNFKEVFGAVEFRMVTTLGSIGGRALNENVVRFGDVGRDGGTRPDNGDWAITPSTVYPSAYGLDNSGSFGIHNTIIHELGHVLYDRSSSIVSNAGSYVLPQVYISPEQGTYWENKNTDPSGEEYLADNFLNWVRDSYVDADPDVYTASDPDNERRIAAFWIGGIEFIESGANRGESEGIQGFADEANAFANLDDLTELKDCIS